nr:MAG TPA: hypothetical protein [Caudoviricetes sp.]
MTLRLNTSRAIRRCFIFYTVKMTLTKLKNATNVMYNGYRP